MPRGHALPYPVAGWAATDPASSVYTSTSLSTLLWIRARSAVVRSGHRDLIRLRVSARASSGGNSIISRISAMSSWYSFDLGMSLTIPDEGGSDTYSLTFSSTPFSPIVLALANRSCWCRSSPTALVLETFESFSLLIYLPSFLPRLGWRRRYFSDRSFFLRMRLSLNIRSRDSSQSSGSSAR